MPLPTGRQDVVVAPGPAFTVDNLRLDAAPAPAAAPVSSPAVGRWTENLRELDVAASGADLRAMQAKLEPITAKTVEALEKKGRPARAFLDDYRK